MSELVEVKVEKCEFCGPKRDRAGWQPHAMWCPKTSEEVADFKEGKDLGKVRSQFPENGSLIKQKGWVRGYNSTFDRMLLVATE